MEEVLSKVLEENDTHDDLIISLEALAEQSKTTKL